MPDATFDPDAQEFVRRLDEAAQAHMAWSRRVLRCAVLRAPPGDDVLADDSHERCRFGAWLRHHREQVDAIDTVAAHRLGEQHRQIHDAAREMCSRIVEGAEVDSSTVDDFERTQTQVTGDLALLKTEYLARSARLDALTGLPLRYGLEDDFKRYRLQALRRGEQVVMVMLDLDHFKRVNDVHGHATGDLALQHVAGLLRSNCRAGEPLYRFGGEEFLVLLQAAGRVRAQQMTERLLEALRDTPLRLSDGRTLSLRMSAGLAEAGTDESMADVVVRADQALYAAKAAGRDTWQWLVAGP